MRREKLLVWLLSLWALAFAWSIIAFSITEPDDFGFTRGMNRVVIFGKWQLVAGMLAIAAWIAGRGVASPRLRRLSLAPLGVFGLEVLAVVGVILWANLSKPAPQTAPPPKATTAPADQ